MSAGVVKKGSRRIQDRGAQIVEEKKKNCTRNETLRPLRANATVTNNSTADTTANLNATMAATRDPSGRLHLFRPTGPFARYLWYHSHLSNGYLRDQFLQMNTNQRTDSYYGGSVENRGRFVLEITEAAVNAVGTNKVGIRFTPWSTFQGMRMPDPLPTFEHVVKRIRVGYPDFAYIHVLEPTTHHRPDNNSGVEKDSNKLLRDIWGDGAYITNSDFGRESAIEAVKKEGGLVSFGHHFISNPDLPLRLKDNLELAASNFKTYFSHGPEGYIDYPFAGGDVKHNL